MVIFSLRRILYSLDGSMPSSIGIVELSDGSMLTVFIHSFIYVEMQLSLHSRRNMSYAPSACVCHPRTLASELRALSSGCLRSDFLSTAPLPQRDVSALPHLGTISQP